MRYLRILLQLVILSAGGVALQLISMPEPDLTAIVGLLGLWHFSLSDTGSQGVHRKPFGYRS